MTLTKSARTGTGLAIIGCLLSVAGCLIEKRPQTTIRLEMEQPRPAVMETPIPGALIQVDDTTKSISGGEPEAVRLDLREAVWCAVENNREIQVARYGPLQAFEALKSSQAAWDPSLVGSGSVGHTDRPTQSLLDTGDMLKKALIEDKTSAKVGISKPLTTGGTLNVFQAIDSLSSNSDLVVPNPQVSSRLVGEFRQPLLRNLDDRQNRSAMNIAGLNLGIARDDLNKAVISVVSETIKGYWQLAYARELVEVNRRSHEMAEEVCRRESVRKDRGLSRPIDVDRARSAMQIRLSQLKRSQSDAYNVSEQLKLLLNIPSLPVGSLFQIVPTEAPQSSGAAVDRDEALAVAIANRTEMEHARKAIEVGRVRKDLAGHLRLPKLDAVSTLSLNGLGSHLNEGFQDEYLRERYSWAVGLELEWPIGNRKAEADYRKETYGFEQALADLKRITQQVLLEIGIAIRQLEVEEEQIKTTRLAKEAAQYVVNGENVRFELGQTTNDELLRAQDILAVAEREYIQSVMNYNVGLMNLAQAQGTLLNSFKIKVEGP